MALIADILLAAGALGAAGYCLVLSRRLQRLTRLEDGVGGAIAVLSAQVDDMTRALKEARTAAHDSEKALALQTARAEQATEQLSLMLASLHDLPDPSAPTATAPAGPAGTSLAHPAVGPAPSPRTARQVTREPDQPGIQNPSDATTPKVAPDQSGTGPITPPTADTPAARGPRFLRRRAVNPKTDVTTPEADDAFARAAE